MGNSYREMLTVSGLELGSSDRQMLAAMVLDGEVVSEMLALLAVDGEQKGRKRTESGLNGHKILTLNN